MCSVQGLGPTDAELLAAIQLPRLLARAAAQYWLPIGLGAAAAVGRWRDRRFLASLSIVASLGWSFVVTVRLLALFDCAANSWYRSDILAAGIALLVLLLLASVQSSGRVQLRLVEVIAIAQAGSNAVLLLIALSFMD